MYVTLFVVMFILDFLLSIFIYKSSQLTVKNSNDSSHKHKDKLTEEKSQPNVKNSHNSSHKQKDKSIDGKKNKREWYQLAIWYIYNK